MIFAAAFFFFFGCFWLQARCKKKTQQNPRIFPSSDFSTTSPRRVCGKRGDTPSASPAVAPARGRLRSPQLPLPFVSLLFFPHVPFSLSPVSRRPGCCQTAPARAVGPLPCPAPGALGGRSPRWGFCSHLGTEAPATLANAEISLVKKKHHQTQNATRKCFLT